MDTSFDEAKCFQSFLQTVDEFYQPHVIIIQVNGPIGPKSEMILSIVMTM